MKEGWEKKSLACQCKIMRCKDTWSEKQKPTSQNGCGRMDMHRLGSDPAPLAMQSVED